MRGKPPTPRTSSSTASRLSASTSNISSTLFRIGRPDSKLFPGIRGAHTPRVSAASLSRTKILQSLATLATQYLNVTAKPANQTVREEELDYLRAIERGDTDGVSVILSVHKIRGDVQSRKRSGLHAADDRRRRVSLHVEDELPFIAEMSSLEKKQSNANNQAPVDNHTPPLIVVDQPTEDGHNRKNRSRENSTYEQQESKGVVFNRNCCDEWGRTGLFIAISRRNLEMMDLLLQNNVEVGECLYHAIDFGYYDVVELLLKYVSVRHQVIKDEDSFYPPGLTPIQLAAHKNDFIMLKILHKHGFRIMGERQTDSKRKGIFSSKRKYGKFETSRTGSCQSLLLEKAWDQSNDRVLYYKAMASPAYLIMMHIEGGFDDETKDDFLERIFRLYEKLKRKASDDPDGRSMYLQLADQVESFSCDLLNEVRSAEDLSNFLRFDPPNSTKTTLPRNHLLPVQTACEVQMKKFVAHWRCQLALSILRRGTLFKSDQNFKTTVTRSLLAFMFPFLCVAYMIAPESKIASLLSNPMVSLSCQMVSGITFLALMVVRLDMKWYQEKDCLGTQPNFIEIVIFIWILAKTVAEIKWLKRTRILATLSDVWKVNDLATLIIFYVVVVLRCIDILRFDGRQNVDEYYCNREKWTPEDHWPVLVSEGCMAFIYILIFVRAMEMMYLHRTFGPLQLSLDKMLVDVIRFGISFFLFTFFAFACAMAQLYWSYGTPRALLKNISIDDHCNGHEGGGDLCFPVYASIHTSLLQQFWTIFGYGYSGEPPEAVKTPDAKAVTEYTGFAVSGIYHCWAVIVMLNMLTAMMARSFDRVRDNAELEWKFLRTNIWMKHIRKEMDPRPPPMNLIPTPRGLKNLYYRLTHFISKCRKHQSHAQSSQLRKRWMVAVQQMSMEKKRYRKAIHNVTNRYLRKYLLEEFQHDEDNQLLLQGINSRPGITPRKKSSMR